MTREEAKLILQAVRPGEADFGDPLVIAALEHVQEDLELAAWWKEERDLDAVIGSKLKAVSIPPGLEARILRNSWPPRAVRHRFQSTMLRLVASIVFIAALLFGWSALSGRGKLGKAESMTAALSEFLKEFPLLDLKTSRWPEINEWVTFKTAGLDIRIPDSMQKYPGIGCRELSWKEKRVFLVCFAANGEVVHLFIIPNSGLAGSASELAPQFSRVRDWSAAAWTQGDNSYWVLTKGSEELLKGIVAARQSRG